MASSRFLCSQQKNGTFAVPLNKTLRLVERFGVPPDHFQHGVAESDALDGRDPSGVTPPGSNGSPISSSDQRSLTASIVEGSVEIHSVRPRFSAYSASVRGTTNGMSSVWRADADGTQSWVVQAGLLHAPINESLYTTSSGWPPSRSMTTGRVHRACATSVAAVRW